VGSAILNVTFDCADPRALARFWGHVTGWPVIEEPQPGSEDSAVANPGGGHPRLYFVRVPEGNSIGQLPGLPRSDVTRVRPLASMRTGSPVSPSVSRWQVTEGRFKYGPVSSGLPSPLSGLSGLLHLPRESLPADL
jgi:hypothetical protein